MKALLVKNGFIKRMEFPSIKEVLGELEQADRFWVDLTIDEVKAASPLFKMTGISEAFVSRALVAKRSKCILARGAYHIHLSAPIKTESFAFKPVFISFNDRFLVSIHPKECKAIEEGLVEAPRDVALSMTNGAALVIEKVVELFYDYVEELEIKASNLEERIVMSGGQQSVLRDILNLKRLVMRAVRNLWSVKGSLYRIKRGSAEFMTSEVASRFDNSHDDVTRQIEILETLREVIADNVEVFTITVFNTTNESVKRTNESIKRLTLITLYLAVVTTVIGFPNTVATIFGVPTIATMVDIPWIFALLMISSIIPLLWVLSILKSYKEE